MADILLPQRSATGPRRVGKAKPGFDLADGADIAAAGKGLAELGMFASRHFDDIRKAKTANEEAEGLGAFKGLVESFNTYSKANPNASPEQLRTQWGKVTTEINKLPSQIGTSSQSKENLMAVFANNMPLAEQKADSFAAAVGSAQQRARSEQQIKGYITDLDEGGLRNHYEEMRPSNIYDDGVIFGPEGKGGGRLDNEIDIINTGIAKRDEAIQKAQLEQLKVSIETQAFALAAAEGFEAAEEMLRDPNVMTQLLEAGVKREDARSLLNDVEERAKNNQVQIDEQVEAQQEVDRGDTYDVINTGSYKLEDGTVSTDIRKFIENTSLDEDEQEAMWQKSIKETERKLKGLDIITNTKDRSQFYKEIPLMLSGAITRDELLNRANIARFGEVKDGKYIEPTLNEKDYASLVKSINAQYEQGYGQMMGRVNDYAEGILLKTDSLGFVENAPVRHKQMGDFQEAWFQWVAGQGENLKISDIYPEGRKLAATFQISDEEAFRREEVFEKKLTDKESKKLTPKIARRYLDIAENDLEEAKRLAAEDGYTE